MASLTVTGCNINDAVNGYAGNGLEIDAVEVYYYTPDSIRPYKPNTRSLCPGRKLLSWQATMKAKTAGQLRGRCKPIGKLRL